MEKRVPTLKTVWLGMDEGGQVGIWYADRDTAFMHANCWNHIVAAKIVAYVDPEAATERAAIQEEQACADRF